MCVCVRFCFAQLSGDSSAGPFRCNCYANCVYFAVQRNAAILRWTDHRVLLCIYCDRIGCGEPTGV